MANGWQRHERDPRDLEQLPGCTGFTRLQLDRLRDYHQVRPGSGDRCSCDTGGPPGCVIADLIKVVDALEAQGQPIRGALERIVDEHEAYVVSLTRHLPKGKQVEYLAANSTMQQAREALG